MDARGELTTLASRAGSQHLCNPETWLKNAPKLCRRTLDVDWRRLSFYVKEQAIPEREIVRKLPLLMDNDLFVIYEDAQLQEEVKTFVEAKELLNKIVGIQTVSHSDYAKRKWREGQETVNAYMISMMSMAAVLKIPEGQVKHHFINTMPLSLRRDLQLFDNEKINCKQLADFAEKLILCAPAELPLMAIRKEEINEIDFLKTEVKSLCNEIAELKKNQNKETQCFKCGKMGHWARDCRQPLTCFCCGGRGHIQRHCPKNGFRPATRPARF